MASIIETTAEWRQDMGIRLIDQINGDLSARRDWEAYRLEAHDLYYGDVASQVVHRARGRVFASATDIHLPVVFENIERLVPKMNNAIWGAHPHVMVERVPDEYDPEETKLQEQFINWAMENDVPNLFTVSHAWFRNMLLDGVGVVKTRWVTTWRRTCEVHRLKTAFKMGEITPGGFTVNEQGREKSVPEILDELFGTGAWTITEDGEDGSIHLNIVEDRRPVEDVRVVFTDKSQFVDEVEILVYRPILVQDSPEVGVVEADQLIVPYRTRDLQKAKRVSQPHWMTVDAVQAEARPSKFDPWHLTEEDVRNLQAAAAGKRSSQADEPENSAFGRHRDDVEGVSPGISSDPRNNELCIYEVYLCEDLDDDGEREELVLQVSPDLRKVLHVTYLDTLHPHGRRPFPTIHFLAPTDRFYVPGLAQFLAPLNIQANITINQVNDRQTLINNPIGFYRPTALMQDPEAMLELGPGTMIPCPDPSGIMFPDWGKAPLADLTIVETVLGFADRVGTSPMSGGVQSQNAPRTARGTLALISEGNLKVDILIEMAQREGFSELLHQLFGLYSTYMPDEKYFWATGRDRKRVPEMMSRKLLRGRFMFEFKGNTVNTNPEVQRTLAQIRYQVGSLNPLYLQDPVKLRELLRDFLTAHSEGTSIDRILPDLPGMGAEPHPPMPQAQENLSMRLHRPVSVLPSDDDLEHMGVIDAFKRSPAFEDLDPVAVTLIAQHYNEHAQQAARKQQMSALGAQTAGGGEQSQGRQMADMGLGNLEGGVA